MLKNCLSFFLTACVLTAVPAAAQDRQTVPFSPVPEVEPFKISPGSSFSASSSHPRPAVSAEFPIPSKHRITADLEEALDVIGKNYGGKIAYEKVIKSSIDAMLGTLDPHSTYFDAAEYREMQDEQRSEYFGIGSTIVNYEKEGKLDTYIISTFPGSPAAQAGLRFGDRIAAVDGTDVSGKGSDIVRDKVRGRNGTVVRLKVERAATGNVDTVTIRRGRVPQPSIPDAYILKPGVGYVDLSEGFNYTTSAELESALRSLRRKGMNSLILDLRGNTGGILEQAVKVAEKFIPAGNVIVSQRGRLSIDNRIWRSNGRAAESLPLVVLVDRNSASASEIVAGAFQDYDRALIVGEKTFGKGLVQSIINLPRGAGLAITTAKYFTPSGRSIQRDYSNGNLYDYFSHRNETVAKVRLAAQTITRRTVYGGDGIEPDEVLPSEEFTTDQLALLDPIFFFAADVANGRVKGLEHYRVDHIRSPNHRLGSNDFAVNDVILAAFANYFADGSSWKLEPGIVDRERRFISTRLRYLLTMAAFGSTTAEQVLIENDPQVAKAVESLPRAAQLAQSARKTLQAAANRK